MSDERTRVVELLLDQARLEHERAGKGGDEVWQLVFQQVGDALARMARRISNGEHLRSTQAPSVADKGEKP